ncbi:MAG: 3-deoxy-7-phosphoheptulonate synthase [Lentisphaerae bacterium]|nr:3-deoxy-7-phosphoheptulonate synthase [Lentisphaerota bacterium]
MIVILKGNTTPESVDSLVGNLKSFGLDVHISRGNLHTVLGLIGDTGKIDIDQIKMLNFVEDVKRIQEPYKNANRKFHPDDSIIRVGDAQIGGKTMTVIAGPCSVESEEQIITVARAVKASGAQLLRGGAFKPRTSPYAFQGLREEGIKLLLKAKKDTGLPIVTEIMDLSQLELFNEVDVIQVGARNMQNFELLKQLGHTQKPILLKRGLANTYQELLMSAEYIMAFGNENVILCERGVRTFESYTRNTLDISAVPVLKKLSHLPVIVDPSHAVGIAEFVPPLAMAAISAGAAGLLIEVHNNPACARCDGMQSLTPEKFATLMRRLKKLETALLED